MDRGRRTNKSSKRSRGEGYSSRTQNRFPPIDFADGKQRAKYLNLSTRKIGATKYLDDEVLLALNFKNTVDRLFDGVSWGIFGTMKEHVYKDVVLEFLSSLACDCKVFDNNDDGVDNNDDGVVRFRLRNVNYETTIARVNEIFGFTNGGFNRIPSSFEAHRVWNSLGSYGPISYRLNKPVHRYIHRFMAHTLFGRGKSTGSVSNNELFFLWCMEERHTVNTGVWLLNHLQHIANPLSEKIVCGGLITAIAREFVVLPDERDRVRGEERLNFSLLACLKLVRWDDMANKYRVLDTHGNLMDLEQEDEKIHTTEDMDIGEFHMGIPLQIEGKPSFPSEPEMRSFPEEPQMGGASSSGGHNIDLYEYVRHRHDILEERLSATVTHMNEQYRSINAQMSQILTNQERMDRQWQDLMARQFPDFYPSPPPPQ